MGEIRPFRPDDAVQVANIYRPIVSDTAVSFESSPPDPEEIISRFKASRKTYPWLVFEHEGQVIGYAYAAPFKKRSAYDLTAEVSVYMARENRCMGRGTTLLSVLIEELKQRGFKQAIAMIALPNDPSERLFERFCFQKKAVLEGVGYKFERWHDIALYQRSL